MLTKSREKADVVVIGPYVMHNFGDDLIGAVLARSLRNLYGAKVVIPDLGYENCKWLGIEPGLRSRDALLKSKSVLIGGGGILGDSGVAHNNRYLYKCLKAAAFARLTKRPMLVTGVGAGPLASQGSRLLCRALCSLASVVGVRDSGSFRFLVDELGLDRRKVVEGADVAFLWPTILDVETCQEETIGVQFDVLAYDTARCSSSLDTFVQLITTFCQKRGDVVLLSNSPAMSQLHAYFDFVPKTLRYRALNPFLSYLKGMRVVITSHLHLAIAAYAARIPCFSIFVREKTRRFYEQIGHPERALDISTAQPEEVQALLRAAEVTHWTPQDESRLLDLQIAAQRLISLCSTLVETNVHA